MKRTGYTTKRSMVSQRSKHKRRHHPEHMNQHMVHAQALRRVAVQTPKFDMENFVADLPEQIALESNSLDIMESIAEFDLGFLDPHQDSAHQPISEADLLMSHQDLSALPQPEDLTEPLTNQILPNHIEDHYILHPEDLNIYTAGPCFDVPATLEQVISPPSPREPCQSPETLNELLDSMFPPQDDPGEKSLIEQYGAGPIDHPDDDTKISDKIKQRREQISDFVERWLDPPSPREPCQSPETLNELLDSMFPTQDDSDSMFPTQDDPGENSLIDQYGAGPIDHPDDETKISDKIKQRRDQISDFVERWGRVWHYNFDVTSLPNGPGPVVLEEQVHKIFKMAGKAFKINASLGMILRNKETGEMRYFAPGPNLVSHRRPVLIHDAHSLNRFVKDLQAKDLNAWSNESRPTTKFVVVRITNIHYEVTKSAKLIGGGVCEEDFYRFKKDKRFIPFIRNYTVKGKPLYQDQLCFFRCLAKCLGHNHKKSEFEDVVNQLFRRFAQLHSSADNLPSLFPGVMMSDLPKLEELFEIAIYVYDVSDQNHLTNLYTSLNTFNKKLHLGLLKDHFVYINCFESLAGKYVCPNCEGVYGSLKTFRKHVPRCPGNTKEAKLLFKGKAYRPKPTVFQDLQNKFAINVPLTDRYHPHVIAYDFESVMGASEDKRENTDKLNYERKHIPVSVALASNIEGFKHYTFILNEDPDVLIDEFIQELIKISSEGERQRHANLGWVLDELENLLIESEFFEGSYQVQDIVQIEDRLKDWLATTPVIGFNSAAYDLKLCRKQILKSLRDMDGKIQYVIKQNGSYSCIKTPHLKFLDVANYLAPGYSYDKFLQAFGTSQRKGHFPYEYFTSLSQLNETSLPDHASFYSSLKQSNITEEEYRQCQKVWRERGMSTFRQYLEYYSSLDCLPFVEALEKMKAFYNSKNLCPFMNASTLPGIVERYLFDTLPPHVYFRSMESENVYHLFRNNICGGPSIVFHRHHARGKTKIRQHCYGDDAETVHKILGWDANSLYLSALAREMPTGPYVVRREETNFKPEFLANDGLATAYLEYLSAKHGIYIQHALNGSEKKFGHWKVDGYIPSTRKVIEVHGCLYHGCKKCTDHSAIHPIEKEKSFGQVFWESEQRCEQLRAHVSSLEVKWECDILQEQEFLQFLKSHRYNERKYRHLTIDSILSRVADGSLFGCVECDIEVPAKLRDHFEEFCPIFKSTNIPFSVIGRHMQTYAQSHGISEKGETRNLISSLWGKKILLSTPLLRWYLEHGLVVRKIYEVIHYTPARCFEKFASEVSEARLAGARDKDKQILAETFKLWGNSAYGRTVMRKDLHTDVKYVDESMVEKSILNSRFKKADELQEGFYEVEMFKSKTEFDLAIQIGFFVLQYAKLRMLELVFDFLLKYIDRRHFQILYMDTDSLYIAITGKCLEDLVRAELLEEYLTVKYQWLVRQGDPEWELIDKYTPGLFKVEFEGTDMVCLNSKTYFCFNADSGASKYSCKGVSKRLNNITFSLYQTVMRTQQSVSGINRGFRVNGDQMWTYSQTRTAFTYYYIKREVLEDGVTTRPLDL